VKRTGATTHSAEVWTEATGRKACGPDTAKLYEPPFGLLHWAGTETASIWNGKMEGALLVAKSATAEVLSPTSSKPDA